MIALRTPSAGFLVLTLLASILSTAPGALAAPGPAPDWPAELYDPNPLPDDLILPLPCGGALALRPVATGALPARSESLPPELRRLYRVVGRFFPGRDGTGSLLMGKYEVTRLQYRTVLAAARGEPCPRQDGGATLPQAEVNHADAETFTVALSRWLDQQQTQFPDCLAPETPSPLVGEGRGGGQTLANPCLPRADGTPALVRLPTADEWSFAARGGLAVTPAEFAARLHPMPAGLAATVVSRDARRSGPAPIGGPRANPLGLHDMIGNVEEILYEPYRLEDSAGIEAGGYEVRGGGFYSDAAELDAGRRREVPPLALTSDTGFRVVVAVPVYTSAARLAEIRRRVPAPGPEPAPGPAATSAPLSDAEAPPPTPEPARQPFEPELVEVPGGSFSMGCSPGDAQCRDWERPAHQVTVQPFRIARHEVTQAQWRAVMGSDPAAFPGDDRPVESVSWDQAQEYLRRLNALVEGAPYRLPSEAEWEYAARAGTATPYRWGQAVGRGRANCRGCGSDWDNRETAPVGSFPPNAFGLHDTAGNVREWVADCWHDGYRGAPADGSEWRGDCIEGRRVTRGGSWSGTPRYARVSDRDWFPPSGRYDHVGLRLARDR